MNCRWVWLLVCLPLAAASATNGATISEVFDSLSVQNQTARVELGPAAERVAVGPGGVEATLADGAALGIAIASETLAYTFATDDGGSPRVRVSADGGGFLVLGNGAGEAIDYDGDLVARFDTLTAVSAGDRAVGPGSISGTAEASFKSGDLTGGLSLRTSAVVPDTLNIMGALSGLTGQSVINEGPRLAGALYWWWQRYLGIERGRLHRPPSQRTSL